MQINKVFGSIVLVGIISLSAAPVSAEVGGGVISTNCQGCERTMWNPVVVTVRCVTEADSGERGCTVTPQGCLFTIPGCSTTSGGGRPPGVYPPPSTSGEFRDRSDDFEAVTDELVASRF